MATTPVEGCICNETCVRCREDQPSFTPYRVEGPQGVLLQRFPYKFTRLESVRTVVNVYRSGNLWYACAQGKQAQGLSPTSALWALGYRVLDPS